jgi:FRG domain
MAQKSRDRKGKTSHQSNVDEELITTLEDYVCITHSRSLEWDKGKEPHSKADAWYRGVLKESRTLLPGYYRYAKNIRTDASEDGLAEEFRRRSHRMLDGQMPRDEWEWYVLMQHYEMPTRLLDWTESSLIALYFAVSDYKCAGKHDKDNGCIWMLDPSTLNELTLRTDEVVPCDRKPAAGYADVSAYLRKDYSPKRKAKHPAAIVAVHATARIAAQRGTFTIHGCDDSPLEDVPGLVEKGRLIKLRIAAGKKGEIRESLRRAGFSEAVVFPELPYLSLDILRSWNLELVRSSTPLP